MGHTIAQIKALLKAEPSAETLKKLQDDPRKGVQTALKTYYKQKEKQAQKLVKFKERLRLEKQLWSNGVEYVAGIDEVGRGPLAGPVVTAAVILPHDFQLVEVNDSKQLSEKKREELYDKILEQAVAVAVGIAENELIDEVNIYQATRIAMKESLEALTIKPGHILIDAMQIDTDIPQTKLIKGDARSASISAASIVAKVNRDHLMKFYDTVYPGYDLGNNAGYGTPKHLAGLAQKGVTPIHRKTFEPVVKYLSK